MMMTQYLLGKSKSKAAKQGLALLVMGVSLPLIGCESLSSSTNSSGSTTSAAGITVTASAFSPAPGERVNLTSAGGRPPYSYTLVGPGTLSKLAGTVFTAPSTQADFSGGSLAVTQVNVTDSEGNTGSVEIDTTDNLAWALTHTSVAQGNALVLNTTGGKGAVQYQVTSAEGTGTISGSTYTAPLTMQPITATLTATDELGVTVTTQIYVTSSSAPVNFTLLSPSATQTVVGGAIVIAVNVTPKVSSGAQLLSLEVSNDDGTIGKWIKDKNPSNSGRTSLMGWFEQKDVGANTGSELTLLDSLTTASAGLYVQALNAWGMYSLTFDTSQYLNGTTMPLYVDVMTQVDSNPSQKFRLAQRIVTLDQSAFSAPLTKRTIGATEGTYKTSTSQYTATVSPVPVAPTVKLHAFLSGLDVAYQGIWHNMPYNYLLGRYDDGYYDKIQSSWVTHWMPAAAAGRLAGSLADISIDEPHNVPQDALSCLSLGANYRVAGFYGTSGAVLDSIGLDCVDATKGVSAPIVQTGTGQGHSAGNSYRQDCPAGQGVVGVGYILNHSNNTQYIQGIEFWCAPFVSGS